MPLRNYDAAFGGKKGSAAKARRAMGHTYRSKKKADQVFYGTVAERMDSAHGKAGLRQGLRAERRKRRKG